MHENVPTVQTSNFLYVKPSLICKSLHLQHFQLFWTYPSLAQLLKSLKTLKSPHPVIKKNCLLKNYNMLFCSFLVNKQNNFGYF